MNRHRCECSICTERGEEIELLKQRFEFSEFEWNRATAGMQERDAEIARLQEAKRAALKLADERAKEANRLRQALQAAPRPTPQGVSDPIDYMDWFFKVRLSALTDDLGK